MEWNWLLLFLKLEIQFLIRLQGLYYAGLFLVHTGKYDKAREYVDRMLKMNPTREVRRETHIEQRTMYRQVTIFRHLSSTSCNFFLFHRNKFLSFRPIKSKYIFKEIVKICFSTLNGKMWWNMVLCSIWCAVMQYVYKGNVVRLGSATRRYLLYPPQTKFLGVYRNRPVRLSFRLSVRPSVRLFTSCPGHNFVLPCPIWI